ncbi:hypothetical protein CcCBS67573_g06190 [Chytriomyces confervae]|uniref:F-box domain-containing protein n=1 Tax=Chytriomyces confervae TaxID=246404 RepID=A0A507F6P4_9FUNG|nr:hypothetical protein CcCBS67573_g06190 [Chytriomyces confervae]
MRAAASSMYLLLLTGCAVFAQQSQPTTSTTAAAALSIPASTSSQASGPSTSQQQPSATGSSSQQAAPTQAPITQVGGPPLPRYGASAQLIRDQGLIVFFGGHVGTPQNGFYVDLNAPFQFQVPQTIVTLSVTKAFTFSTGEWNSVTNTNLTIPAPNLDSDPRVTAYGVSAIARGIDVGATENRDVFYYLFGQNYNVLIDSTVYQYNQGSNLIGVLNKQPNPPPGRDRAISCMIDPSTLLIHGGMSGTDNDVKTLTLRSTLFVSLKNISGTEKAWLPLQDNSQGPTLHDHMGECLRGNVYAVGGVTDQLTPDGNAVVAPMEHVWVFSYDKDYTRGSWTKVPVNAPDGVPTPRRSGTLTALDPNGDILLLHGGTAVDFSETYSDLWELNVKTYTWKRLTPSIYSRHSHNAIAVNGMLITAFGVMSDFNSTKVPNVVTPPLWVYDSTTNKWGGFPASAALSPAPPGPMPAHVPAFSTQTQTAQPPPATGVNPAIIYGSIAGVIALILAVSAYVTVRNHKRNNSEKEFVEENIADQLHAEDRDLTAAHAGIMGREESHGRNSRMVGGKLAKLIHQKSTGIYSTEVMDDEEAPEADKRKSTSSIESYSSAQIRYILENTDAPAAGASDPKSPGTNEGSGSDSGGNRSSIMSGIVGRPISLLGSILNKMSTEDLKNVVASDKPGGSKNRASMIFFKEEAPKEPLRPWELPGMGVQSQSKRPTSQQFAPGSVIGGPATSMSRDPSRSSLMLAQEKRINLNGLIGELPAIDLDRDSTGSTYNTNYHKMNRVPSYASTGSYNNNNTNTMQAAGRQNSRHSYTNMHIASSASDLNKRVSVYSNSSSSAYSSTAPSSVEMYDPDPTQSMRALFARFTDEQILYSWNAYSATTGHVYTIEQVSAMRAMHSQVTDSETPLAEVEKNILDKRDAKGSPLTMTEPLTID